MVVNEQIKQIASRIIYMRETLELSQTDVAEKIGMPPEEYIAYETGEKDLPVSMIYSVATALGIDATELLTGETPHLTGYAADGQLRRHPPWAGRERREIQGLRL